MFGKHTCWCVLIQFFIHTCIYSGCSDNVQIIAVQMSLQSQPAAPLRGILRYSFQSCGTSCQYMSGKQTPPLTLGLTLSSLIKLIVRDGSGDPKTSHSCAAIGLDCWQTSHDTPLLTVLFFLYVHMTFLLSLPCVSLSQQVSLVWCNGVCGPLFPVLSTPSWSRQMANLPESGSARGFFLLKGSRSSPQSPHACSVWEIGVSVQSVGFLS